MTDADQPRATRELASVDAADAETFRKHTQQGLPFIIVGALKHWCASDWTAETLARQYGDVPLCVRMHPHSSSLPYEGECYFAATTMSEFCAWLTDAPSARGDRHADGASSYASQRSSTSLASRFPRCEYVGYADYQDMAQIFSSSTRALSSVDWSFAGGASDGVDTTLWLGSGGSSTPMHYDTYGANVVAQLAGTKRWRLLPPGTQKLQESRIPYEESSVFADTAAADTAAADACVGFEVDLHPGEVLYVPRHWWHRVNTPVTVTSTEVSTSELSNIEVSTGVGCYALSVNTWLETPEDAAERVREAVVRALATALIAVAEELGAAACVAVPAAGWVNPTELMWSAEENVAALHRAVEELKQRGDSPDSTRRQPLCAAGTDRCAGVDGDTTSEKLEHTRPMNLEGVHGKALSNAHGEANCKVDGAAQLDRPGVVHGDTHGEAQAQVLGSAHSGALYSVLNKSVGYGVEKGVGGGIDVNSLARAACAESVLRASSMALLAAVARRRSSCAHQSMASLGAEADSGTLHEGGLDASHDFVPLASSMGSLIHFALTSHAEVQEKRGKRCRGQRTAHELWSNLQCAISLAAPSLAPDVLFGDVINAVCTGRALSELVATLLRVG